MSDPSISGNASWDVIVVGSGATGGVGGVGGVGGIGSAVPRQLRQPV